MTGDKGNNQLDMEELSRLVDSSEPDGEISIDAILAEYRESSKAAPAASVRPVVPYMPENDKELSRNIASVVDAVMDAEEQRRLNARRLEEFTKRQNRKSERYETLANTAALKAQTVVSAKEKRKLEKVARKAQLREDKLQDKRRRKEARLQEAEPDTLPPPTRRTGTAGGEGDTQRLPGAAALRTVEKKPPVSKTESAQSRERSRAAIREEILRELPVKPLNREAQAAPVAVKEPTARTDAAKVIDLQSERSRRDGKKPTGKTKKPKQAPQPKKKPKKEFRAPGGPKAAAPEQRREPTIQQALKTARKTKTFLGSRALASWVISVVLIYLSAAGELGLPMLPMSGKAFLVVSFALNGLVTLLCGEVLVLGIKDLIRLRPGTMSLMAVADILTLAVSLVAITRPEAAGMEPMNAVCAALLAAELTSERRRHRAMIALYKAASGVSSPYVVTAEPAERFGRTALIKTESPPEGFVTLSRMPDKCSRVMQVVAPVLLVLCPVLALIVTVPGACSDGFLRAWSVLAAAAVPLAVGAASTLPLSYAVDKLAHSGCAVAGFGGADVLARHRRVAVTDRDVFPPGCVSFNGMKIVDSRSSEKIISVTASLVRASGSGLTRLFTDLMNEQMGQWRQVERFEFLDGGFGGVVDGEYVMCGSADFMRMRGVELPKGLRAKHAVFTAFGTKLSGVFALSYTGAPASEDALNTLLYNNSQPYLVSTDFNVTPAFLENRFKLARGRIGTPESGRITAEEFGTPPAAAVICREGLGPYADTVTCGRKMAGAVRTNTIYVLLALAVGLLLCTGLMFMGAGHVLTQGKLVIYMLAWLIPVWLSSIGVRRY